MMLNKKAQNLSINTIIIAALALLALVVIGVLFLRGINPIGGEIGDASKCNTANGGQCVEVGNDCPGPFSEDTGDQLSCSDTQRCCKNPYFNK